MSQRFTIIRADASHAAQIKHLWTEVFKIADVDGRYEWLYKLAPHAAIAYVAIDNSTGAVAGMAALYLCEYRQVERRLRVGIAADFSVLPSYRVFGPARELQRSIMQVADTGELDFILAYPNKKALKLMLSGGYVSYAGTWIGVRHAKAWRVFRNKIHNPIMAGAASMVYWIYTKIAASVPALLTAGMRIEPELHNNLHDDLVHALPVSDQPYCGLVKIKATDYLTWRYLNNPVKDIFTLPMHDAAGKLRFLAFVSIANDKLAIIDILGATSAWHYLKVVSCIMKFAACKGVATIESVFACGKKLRLAMLLNGFILKRYDRELLVYPEKVKATFASLAGGAPVFEADMDV